MVSHPEFGSDPPFGSDRESGLDIVTHFPQTTRKHDAVWVIVDHLTKLAHFLVVWMTFTLEEF